MVLRVDAQAMEQMWQRCDEGWGLVCSPRFPGPSSPERRAQPLLDSLDAIEPLESEGPQIVRTAER